jgi:hypothetical protein
MVMMTLEHFVVLGERLILLSQKSRVVLRPVQLPLGSFPRLKWPKIDVDHSPTVRAVVQERNYSSHPPYVPSCRG